MPAIAARQEFPTGDKPSPLSVSITSSHKELTRVISRCRSRERDNPTCRSERKKINVSICQNEQERNSRAKEFPFERRAWKFVDELLEKFLDFFSQSGFPIFAFTRQLFPKRTPFSKRSAWCFSFPTWFCLLFYFLSLSLSLTHTQIFLRSPQC